ncbi:MAG TPA: VacB/RNase II family 3'-5' exoribonuclease, partial [Pseudomonas sp.]|nr:VacB/RNase II family 3'-5' exoribonuclease [Pseudomonas sp.]
VCEITLARSGKMIGYQFYEAVIQSHARLTYDAVSAMLERPRSAEGKQLLAEHASIAGDLKQLYAVYKALQKQRHVRGAIDFETRETRIVFGQDRKIAEILPTERNDAHKLIEECMLCANVAMASFLQDHEMDGLYRVHDGPPAEKLEKLRGFLTELGLTLNRGKGDPTPKDYLLLLESVRERPDFQLIQTVMLRSLSQAVYSPDNNGHFGLNYEAYTHFTSPIRRYADLLNHRAVRSVIRSRKETEHVQRVGASAMPKARIYPYDLPSLEQIGVDVSLTERRADEATRDVVTWLKCEFMLDRVGDTFAGVVTSVTGFGLFVELTDIYVEGLVHVTALPGDYYQFDPLHHRLTGERSGRSYRLGDTVEVIVARVDLDERKIDFEMSQDNSNTDKHPVSAPKKGQSVKNGKKTDAAKAQGAAGAKSGSSTKDAAVKSKAKTKSRKRKVVSKSTKAGHYE